MLVLKGGDAAVPLCEGERGSSRAPGIVAVSCEESQWLLLNVSPPVADQLGTDARLLMHAGLILPSARSVLLTDSQVDHLTGLLTLRDGPPIHLYATPAVFEELSQTLPVLPMLQHYCGVHWHVIPVAGECSSAVFAVDGMASLEFTAIATQAPLPAHVSAHSGRRVGDTIAVAVRDRRSGQRLFCAPCLQGVGAQALAWMAQADGIVLGVGSVGAAALRKLMDAPVLADAVRNDVLAPGLDGQRLADVAQTVQALAALPARRKILMAASATLGLGHAGDAKALPWLAQHGLELAGDRMQVEL